jgi:hypothetical protein
MLGAADVTAITDLRFSETGEVSRRRQRRKILFGNVPPVKVERADNVSAFRRQTAEGLGS